MRSTAPPEPHLARTPFALAEFPDPRWLLLLKRFLAAVVVVHLVLGTISAYRAYHQVHSLQLRTSAASLHDGSTIGFIVVSYARTPVDVRLELIQGTRAETLADQRVPDNHLAGYDPRPRRASHTVVLTPELLGRFEAGPAVVRATAVGRPQWLRLPPPMVRELDVELRRRP